ncbi:MAG TPA: aminotransferase class I/II-fold pyridoxal phosphate-dependent enzyme [Candidatus Thermoplasmatota archaeon]|nr:aminotransferase class I/II-fold pyridoxal phosphate-dependent enzyme [Candidatus Thermoplasmatota archaeon]
MISKRSERLLGERPPLVKAHFEAVADPYHPSANPEGYVNFGAAENRLLWDLEEPILNAPRGLEPRDVHYRELYGTPEARAAVARFLGRTTGVAVDAEDIVLMSGASAILDTLAATLADAGEAIAIPTPYYPGFDHDLTARADVQIAPVPLSSADGYMLTPERVDKAIARAESSGRRVRAVLVNTPHNPLGRVYPPGLVGGLIDLVARREIHLVVDEIYANSVYGGDPFASALALAHREPGRVHLVYGLAKDFGLSGLKVGVLHTRNPQVRAAMREHAYLAPVSTDTQALVARLLADDAWTTRLVETSRERLRKAYETTTDALAAHGIPFLPATAGLFVWIDLRGALAAPTLEAEKTLWRALFERGRVNVSPGHVFHESEPGWFRLCFADDPSVVAEGVRRIARIARERGA